MKIKFVILSIFITVVSGFMYLSLENSVAGSDWDDPLDDKFVYGAIQSIWSYPNYDSLALNTTHCYISTVYNSELGRHVPMGWAGSKAGNYDSLTAPVASYINDLRFAKNTMYSHNQSRFLYQRPKIEWLAFGQSSIYEAEPVSTNADLWFYSFNVSVGETVTDNGKTVLHCRNLSMGQNAGIVLQRLKANTEQCKRSQSDGSENHWQCDSESDWLIKPRIRIEPAVVNNTPNLNVCRIIVLNQNRDTIKNALIKAVNFKDPVTGQYGGQYQEEFHGLTGSDSLKIRGDWGDWWSLSARGNASIDSGRNAADIQIYWYDNCDIWIDYVKVENDVAHRLLKGNDPQFEEWIKAEADIAKESPAIYKFYVEIIEFNNLPCINYVNQKLRSYTGNQTDLIVDFDPAWGLLYHVNYRDLPTVSSARWLHDNFIARGGFTALLTQCYPMRSRYTYPLNPDAEYTFSRLPPTLPSTRGPGILALVSSTTNEYDSWLQTNFESYPFFLENGTMPDGLYDTTHPCGPTAYAIGPKFYGYMRYTMQVSHEISRIGNIPFIFMPQAHHWYYPWEIDREPTNEELEVMANLGISYGARGLMWWWYPTIINNSDTVCPRITYGMQDPDGSLRDQNVYGQSKSKWKVFRDIGVKVKKWEPYLMSFNNTERRSYVYQNEYIGCNSETFFNSIMTYSPNSPLSSNPSAVPDAQRETYIQASVFKKEGEPEFFYFMIVNRRCSPVTSMDDGGKRFVKAEFDNTLSGIWEIEDLFTNQRITINTSASHIAELGWFMPAEGRLYKMKTY